MSRIVSYIILFTILMFFLFVFVFLYAEMVFIVLDLSGNQLTGPVPDLSVLEDLKGKANTSLWLNDILLKHVF